MGSCTAQIVLKRASSNRALLLYFAGNDVLKPGPVELAAQPRASPCQALGIRWASCLYFLKFPQSPLLTYVSILVNVVIESLALPGAGGFAFMALERDKHIAERALLTMDEAQLLALYRSMSLIRRFEEKTAEMYARGKITGLCHLNLPRAWPLPGQRRLTTGGDGRALWQGDRHFTRTWRFDASVRCQSALHGRIRHRGRRAAACGRARTFHFV